MEKFFGIPQNLCDLFGWMLNPDGSLSDAFKAEIAAFVYPTGSFVYSATLNMGSAFLQCTGVAVSRTTYAALFAAIGTRYGAGDGSTTFNLPNVQGRSLIGAGTGTGLTFRDITAVNAGEEKHQLTEAENGPHRHLIADPNSTEQLLTANHALDSNVTNQGLLNYTLRGELNGEATVGRTSISGAGAGHNTVHPCVIAFCFIRI